MLTPRAHRALMLWANDPDLIYALEVSKRSAEHTEYLMLFWPNTRKSYARYTLHEFFRSRTEC